MTVTAKTGIIASVMRKQRYATLQDWMDRTGTNQTKLREMVKIRTDRTISAPTLSGILRGSRRCSRANAFALSMTTGVPFEELIRWPRCENKPNVLSVA